MTCWKIINRYYNEANVYDLNGILIGREVQLFKQSISSRQSLQFTFFSSPTFPEQLLSIIKVGGDRCIGSATQLSKKRWIPAEFSICPLYTSSRSQNFFSKWGFPSFFHSKSFQKHSHVYLWSTQNDDRSRLTSFGAFCRPPLGEISFISYVTPNKNTFSATADVHISGVIEFTLGPRRAFGRNTILRWWAIHHRLLTSLRACWCLNGCKKYCYRNFD